MSAGPLQRELKRKTPFASLQQEAVLSVLRTSDRMENLMTRFFREHDLTLSQFNLLRILQLEGGPLTCGEIGSRLIQVVPAITGLVDRLESRGLVERQRCKEDRRVVRVALTASGAALTAAAFAPLIDFEKRMVKGLKREELKQLVALLEKVRHSLDAVEV